MANFKQDDSVEEILQKMNKNGGNTEAIYAGSAFLQHKLQEELLKEQREQSENQLKKQDLRNEKQMFWTRVLVVGTLAITMIGLFYSVRTYYDASEINRDFYRPFIYIDGTGKKSGDDKLSVTFSLGNSGRFPARIVDFDTKSKSFKKTNDNNIDEMILNPGELKYKTIFFERGEIQDSHFNFTTRIYYYNLVDESERSKYCIEYNFINTPELESTVGIQKVLSCE